MAKSNKIQSLREATRHGEAIGVAGSDVASRGHKQNLSCNLWIATLPMVARDDKIRKRTFIPYY